MRIAIPVAGGKLAMHFGHCEEFALFDVEERRITRRETVAAPPHQPGLLPPWLGEKGVTLVIAGGMGQRALGLFAEQNIEVRVGAPGRSPEKIVDLYLRSELPTGKNVCDH